MNFDTKETLKDKDFEKGVARKKSLNKDSLENDVVKKGANKKALVGTVAKGVLGVVAVGGAVALFAALPGLPLAFTPFIKKDRYRKKYSKQQICRSVDSLVRNGFLKKTLLRNGDYKLVLTKKGKKEAFLQGFYREVESGKKKKWDGLWRIIVFDIPEKKRGDRDELRRACISYGFRILQKSVWVYPHPCEDFIGLLKKHLGVSHDLLYLTSNFIENDTHLKKEFGL